MEVIVYISSLVNTSYMVLKTSSTAKLFKLLG